MSSRDSETELAYAALLAASDAVISQRHPRPSVSSRSGNLRPNQLGDIHRLVAAKRDEGPSDFERKLARVTCASLIYASQRSDARAAQKLAERRRAFSPFPEREPPSAESSRRRAERVVIESLLHESERPHFEACRDADARYPQNHVSAYVQLCNRLLYGSSLPPVIVVNHGARVETDFIQEKNISEAWISQYQVIVPEPVAYATLLLSHPLYWKFGAPSLFRRSEPAVEQDGGVWGAVTDPVEQVAFWEDGSFADDERFLYESVSLRQNEYLSADVDNIISVRDWSLHGFREHATVAERVRARSLVETWSLADYVPPPDPQNGVGLSFRYALKNCLCSSYGVVSEDGGLDIDDGNYVGTAKPLSAVTEHDLAALERRDLEQLLAYESSSYGDGRCVDELYDKTPPSGERLSAGGASRQGVEHLRRLGRHLSDNWSGGHHGQEAWLLTVSASKRLRFTVPQHSPIDLFSLLTFSAPTSLFTFINQAVCHAPHIVADKLFNQPTNLPAAARAS